MGFVHCLVVVVVDVACAWGFADELRVFTGLLIRDKKGKEAERSNNNNNKSRKIKERADSKIVKKEMTQ